MYCSPSHRRLHSFPTRRSSDLGSSAGLGAHGCSSSAVTVPFGGVIAGSASGPKPAATACAARMRSEEHTSELQSLRHLVCRLLLEKKNSNQPMKRSHPPRTHRV